MDRLNQWLEKQRAASGLRTLHSLEKMGQGRIRLADGSLLVDFSSNDYLALSEHPKLKSAAQEALARFGTGSGAARLMSGDLTLHHELEEAVARLKNKPAALTFGSGYMANAGIIPAIAGRGDVVFTDRLNHASIYDGVRLAGAEMVRFFHNNPTHLEEMLKKKRGTGTALIVVESIYSMDGDRCPLKDLVALKEKYDCLLMVDEAHATGVFGKNGGGVIEEAGVSAGVDLAMGTFGKALGSYGAYVAASQEMIDFLINRARSFIFSTALPPAVAAASLAAVELIQEEPDLRNELNEKVRFFKSALTFQGIKGDLGPSQIIPIMVGTNKAALAAAEKLREQEFFVTAVRPPTVPEGTARLRFSITRHLKSEDLNQAARAIGTILS
jgi:glycine C-acetyltransferase/8-amino-7-oxononanoate synthase